MIDHQAENTPKMVVMDALRLIGDNIFADSNEILCD